MFASSSGTPPWAGVRATSLEWPLEWSASPHSRRLFYVALLGLGVAVATRRAEFVAFAAPGVVFLGAYRRPRLDMVGATLRLSAARVYEGEQLAVEVKLEGADDLWVEMVLHPVDGVRAVMGDNEAGPGRTALAFQVDRWGRRSPGFVEVVMRDRYRVFESHCFASLPEVACYPRPARHRRAVTLGRLASRSGDHPARAAGEGVEFAGVRQYATGDRQRSINWAATTRRGRLQVNTFASERSQDIVLIADASSEVGPLGATSLDGSVRGALGVARTYLDARDRVGLVLLGERLAWIPPGLGNRQFFRLMETMLEVAPGWSPDDEVNLVPRAALPPGASVIAFSPLLDIEFVEALRDLRQRNFPVVVVDVLNVEPGRRGSRSDRLARRIWRMQRQALIFSLGEMGIPVVAWDGEEPLALPEPRRARSLARSRI